MQKSTPHEESAYSEAETAAREEATIKRMLATPPEPHKPIGKRKRVESMKGA